MPTRTPSSIDFSRILGISETTAIGLSVCLPAAIFVAGDLILQRAGADAPLIFVLAAILFLPIVLTYCELAVGVPGSGSAYRIARSSGSATRAFGVGWLMLGGLIALAAVLIEEEARRISMMLDRLVDVPYSVVVFTVIVAVLAALNQWLVREDRWRTRTALVWIAGISFVGLLVWVLVLRPSDFATLPAISVDAHDLASLTMLAAGLWSIDLILNYRRVMRNPDRTTRNSVLLVWVGTAALGSVAAAIVVRYPSLLIEDELSRLGWADPRVEVIFNVSSVVLIWLGLSRVISRAVRLAGALELHGYIPALASGRPGSWRRQLSGLTLFTILLVPAAIFVSSKHLLEFSALAYLWATILTFLPHVRRPARGSLH
jgi:amino acid transporter